MTCGTTGSCSYNACQNCWEILHRVVYNMYTRPPLLLFNVESSIFVHLLLADPNIAWWGRGRYRMFEDSVDFVSKKAQFQHIKINVDTIKLIWHFCISVPTTFDKHCSYMYSWHGINPLLSLNSMRQKISLHCMHVLSPISILFYMNNFWYSIVLTKINIQQVYSTED